MPAVIEVTNGLFGRQTCDFARVAGNTCATPILWGSREPSSRSRNATELRQNRGNGLRVPLPM